MPMMAVDGRRLWRAGLLTLAVFLLVGGGIGFAVAASQDGSGELVVPSPRPGDRAVYQVTRDIVDSHLGDADDIVLDEVVYEWLPETTILDASFTPHPVQPLQATYVFGKGLDWEARYVILTSYDPATGLPIHQASESRSTAPQYFLPGTVGPVGQQVAGMVLGTRPPIETSYWGESFAGALAPPCGQRFPAQAGGDALYFGSCGWPGHSQPPFVPTGWSSLSTGPAFGYEAQEDARLQVWYQSGTPFPLRVVASMSEVVDPAWVMGRLFTLDRVAWARGETDYATHGPVVASAPVDLVPLVPGLMFDDAGLDPELPLERAYQTAYDAPRTSAATGIRPPNDPYQPQPAVREWLADHPDGYLAVAQHFLGWGWSEQYPGWALLWVDGSSWLGKVVVYDSSVGDESHVFMPEQLPKRLTVADWRISDEVAAAWLATFPSRDRLPTVMPSAAAVTERFHAFVSPADLSYFGFRFHCGEACLRGAPAQAHVSVGHTNSSFNPSTSATGGSSTTDGLTIGGDGFVVTRSRYTREAVPVLGLGAPSKEETPPAGATRGSAGVWAMPSGPAAATGISFVAVLAGALYYFWPAIKGGAGLGLFSRIEPSSVLDLPTRRRVHDAIVAEPGIHFMALARKADVGRSALDHHLRRLVAADLVVVRKTPGYTCYFAKGAVDRKLAETAPALRSEGSRAVFDAVRAEPGLSCRELARRLGRSPSTVNYHLQRLREAGLVFGAGAGVHPSPLAEQAAAMAA